MGLQDQEKIKEGCETGFGGDTEPCQSPWKSRETRPWKNDGEAMNSPTLVCYVSRKRAHRKKKLLRKATRKGLGARWSKKTALLFEEICERVSASEGV
jgi:hypothetical protein